MVRSLFRSFEPRVHNQVPDGATDDADGMEDVGEIADELDHMDFEVEHDEANYDDDMDYEDQEIEESEDSTENTAENLSTLLKSVSDKSIKFLTSCCIARSSDADFERLSMSLDENVAKESRSVWTSHKHISSSLFICNKCGMNTGRQESCVCGGVTIKFVRIGCFSQVHDIVEANLSAIVKLHNKVKTGQETHHNLASAVFRQVLEAEGEKELLLSSVLSVDGVSVKGNTKKLWPVSLFLLDLPTVHMQRSTNIVMCGIAEGVENPATPFWNSVFPIILRDVEAAAFHLGGYQVRNSIVSFVGDQMAKRPFFGMKGHSSAKSCFFCLSEGTMYKEYGKERYMERPGDLTDDDAKNAQNGFGECYSVVNAYIRITDTPIDVLHVFGEGLYERIISELYPLTKHTSNTRKSQLFVCDRTALEQCFSQIVVPPQYRQVIRRRNGSDKITFFRSFILLASLACDLLSAECRFALLSLSLLTSKMYTESGSATSFYMRLTTAARHFLVKASPRYLSIKAHEGLYHLAYCSQRLGNNAPLSTFAFESFYQYALSGFSSRKTRGFVEGAADRVLFHGCLRRELTRRLQEAPSKDLALFCSMVPDLIVPSENIQSKIPQSTLRPEDAGEDLHSELTTKVGKFVSHYKDNTGSAAYFFDTKGAVYRFLGAFESSSVIKVLAEEVVPLDSKEQFISLRSLLPSLSADDACQGTKIIEQLLDFDGILDGKLSGIRCVLDIDNISGQCGRLETGRSTLFIKLNGAGVHN